MGHKADRRRHGRWARRAAYAAVIPLVTAAAQPAYADPVPATAVPDSGAEPAPSAPVLFPAAATAQPAQPSAAAVGPLAAEIIAASDAAQRLGEQVKALEDELHAAQAVTEQARDAWEAADAALTGSGYPDAPASPSTSASNSASMPAWPSAAATDAPSPTVAPSSTGMGTVVPTPSTTPSAGPSTAVDPNDPAYLQLVRAERQARGLLDAAVAAQGEVAGRHDVVVEQFQRRTAALNTLTTRNASLLDAAERAREAYEQSLAASRGLDVPIEGLQAAPQAQAAVAFALSQLGKPYEWAAEGPNTYDCSGLVMAAYLSVGKKLPRVANNQYGAGVPVLASQLLPGDLIFFSTDRADWRQIHHVAMYIGNGKVVHAPTFGDVVKVSTIWWSEYFGASRIIPAVPVPTAPPAAPAAPSSPSSSPSPSTSPAAASPMPSPSVQASASPDPSPTAAGSASPDPSPAPSPSASASPSASPSASATVTPSPSPQPSPSGLVDSTAVATAVPTTTGRRRRWLARR